MLVAFYCWKRLQSSVISLSSLIITPIPPPHILLLRRHHIRGFSRLTLRPSRCWIRLVSGPTMARPRCVALGALVSERDLPFVRDRAPRLRLTNNRNRYYHAVLLRPIRHYLADHRRPSFSHYLQWMWQQKIATKAEPASDINHRDGAPLIRAIWLKVKGQRAPLTRHRIKEGRG